MMLALFVKNETLRIQSDVLHGMSGNQGAGDVTVKRWIAVPSKRRESSHIWDRT